MVRAKSPPVSKANANAPLSRPFANSDHVFLGENSSHAPKHHRPGASTREALACNSPIGACPCAARELERISR